MKEALSVYPEPAEVAQDKRGYTVRGDLFGKVAAIFGLR
jgi:hypothetical protein